jgi:hypothetical protein
MVAKYFRAEHKQQAGVLCVCTAATSLAKQRVQLNIHVSYTALQYTSELHECGCVLQLAKSRAVSGKAWITFILHQMLAEQAAQAR